MNICIYANKEYESGRDLWVIKSSALLAWELHQIILFSWTLPILNWSCCFFAPSVSAKGCSRACFILMPTDSVVICNLHFFSDSLYPFVLLPMLAIILRRGLFLFWSLCLNFLFIWNWKKMKDSERVCKTSHSNRNGDFFE